MDGRCGVRSNIGAIHLMKVGGRIFCGTSDHKSVSINRSYNGEVKLEAFFDSNIIRFTARDSVLFVELNTLRLGYKAVPGAGVPYPGKGSPSHGLHHRAIHPQLIHH